MRPPVCAICEKELTNDDGGLIYFRKSEAEKEWDKNRDKDQPVSHPPYVEWFCAKHYALANKYNNLTRDEALKKIEEG